MINDDTHIPIELPFGNQVPTQAARTAWKITHDWVELQLTLIELDQIEVMEAFLPYVYNQGSKETFYEHAKSKGFKQLTN